MGVAIFRFPKRKLRKLVQQGEYVDAIEFGQSIEGRFSNDPDFLFIMGTIYYLVEDASHALAYFDRSLKIKPDDVEPLHLKANIHLHLEQHDEAQECCTRILELDPGHKEAQQILDFLNS